MNHGNREEMTEVVEIRILRLSSVYIHAHACACAYTHTWTHIHTCTHMHTFRQNKLVKSIRNLWPVPLYLPNLWRCGVKKRKSSHSPLPPAQPAFPLLLGDASCFHCLDEPHWMLWGMHQRFHRSHLVELLSCPHQRVLQLDQTETVQQVKVLNDSVLHYSTLCILCIKKFMPSFRK